MWRARHFINDFAQLCVHAHPSTSRSQCALNMLCLFYHLLVCDILFFCCFCW